RCRGNSGVLQDGSWDLRTNFKRALDAKEIGIPYPQRDGHLHQQTPSDAVSSPAQPQ
ncbi:MAG TPA: mechanosensitive ion channel protein MscS, partial [Pantoea sp.]|nr:mechanosensitive ion channel protein MscS [Pantoea sp.]